MAMTRKPTVSAGFGRSLPATLAIGLAAVTLAGCGSSETSSSASISTPAQTTAKTPHASTAGGPCASSQLALSYAGTEGATGHLELTLALRNVGASACLLQGYPEARLLDRAGRTLPLHVSHGGGFFPDTMPAPRAVTVKPGASAHFGISFATNNEYKGARVCHTARSAMSAAPGAAAGWHRVSLRSAPQISPCGNQLVVSPVHA
jgi:Protein of unknown function (DUF4232)